MMSGWCLGAAWRVSEGCLEVFWGVTGELSGDVKGMSEGCLDDVWVVSWGLCRVS